MTKAEIINELAISTGYDKTTITTVAEAFMNSIKKNLVDGENIYLRGFGTFSTRKRKEKIARNIKKHMTVLVPAHRVAIFKPSAQFAQEVK